MVEGFEEYEVKELTDSWLYQGKLQYLVKWKGYPNCTDWTWEPEDKILQDDLDEFHEKHPQAPQRILVHLNFQKLACEKTEPMDCTNGKLSSKE